MRRFDIDERDDDGPEPGAAMREAVSPEPDETPQAKAAAMRRAAKAALKANPEIEASVTRQPEPLPEPEPTGDAPEPSESVSQGSDHKRLPWRGNGEGPSFNATVNVPTEPTNAAELEVWLAAKAVKDPATGEMVHPKELRRREAKRQEAESIERHAGDQPSGKMAFSGDVGTDHSYEVAKLAHEQAEAHLRALQVESAGLTSRIHEAIASGDFDTLKALRTRQAELPHELDAARMGAIDARIAYLKPRAARARIAKQQARTAAHEVNEAFQEWQRKIAESQSSAHTAEYEADDAVRDLGAAMRERDALVDELVNQRAPQGHRVPVGVVGEGADVSYMTPMPRPSSI